MMTFIRRKVHGLGYGQNASKMCILNDMTLHQLISEQDWDAVEGLLEGPTKSINFSRLAIRNDLILHFALQFDPPLRIITTLYTHFPSGHSKDGNGRYPIHVAVASGCDLSVISFLIRTNPAAAGAQDQTGRTPMHYAGKCYAKNYADFHFDSPLDHIDEVCRSTLRVVDLLSKAAIQTVNLEDENEMNPIEYALLSATNINVVKMMQRASRIDWIKKRHLREPENDNVQDKLPMPPSVEMCQSYKDFFKSMYDKPVDVDIEPLFTPRHKRGTVPARMD